MGNSCWPCPPTSSTPQSPRFVLPRPVPSLQEAARLQQASQHPSREAACAEVTDPDKSSSDRQLLRSALSTHTVFSCLEEEGREAVITCMKQMRVPAREFVVEQGFKAAYYFVLGAGKAEVLVDRQRVRLISEGDGFGEEALLHSTARSFAVRTLSESRFWALDRFSFRRFVETVNARALQSSESFVRSLPLFQGLSEFQLEALVNSFTVRRYSKDQVVLREGAKGDWLYLLQEGSVLCSSHGQVLRRLQTGALFGELAYLSNGRRTATVTALCPVLCLSIGAKQLVAALGSCVQSVLYANTITTSLEQSGLSRRLLDTQRARLVRAMRIESFDEGTIVVSQGTALSSGLWVVLQGTLSLGGEIYASTGECIGLETSSPLSRNLIVTSETADIAWLSRSEIETCLGCAWTATTAEAFASFTRLPLFRWLPEAALMELARRAHLAILTEPQIGFFAEKSGEICYGARWLLGSGNDTSDMMKAGTYWSLTKEEFSESVSVPLQRLMHQRLDLAEATIVLQDLHPTRILGQGMFGLVFEVQHRSSQALYALKTVSRATVARYHLHNSVLQEKNIMQTLDHPLVAKLVHTFKDSKRLYFLQELVHGTDFFEVLRALGLMSDCQAQFYAASLILVLDYLHSRNVVYRDLKPENFMVDAEGYIKLVDFGTAKVLSGRTFSVVGTPHYMAPEVVLGKGYGLAVDLWSLGVVIYEMVCGMVPFAEEVNDPYAVYEKILDHSLVFPDHMKSDCRVFVEQLLSPDPTYRGNSETLSLRRHKWLQGFDWAAMESRTLPAPYLPQTSLHATDQQACLDAEEEESSEDLSAPPPNWDQDF